MSLTNFVRLPDVAERLKPFRPPVKAVGPRLLVPSASGHPQLAGTAFDYLLRFELQRRTPHAAAGEWIAEHVPQLIWGRGPQPGTWVGRDYLAGRGPSEYLPPQVLAARVAAVCRGARLALDEYLQEAVSSDASRRTLAAWAVRLAKMDGVYRRDEFDPTFDQAPAALTEELVALLGVVPFRLLTHPESLLLNPDFGEASRAVGGADADLIAGDLLVDVKTTKSAAVTGEALDQLFGYFILARRAGLPPIRRMGIYFSRFAQLRTGQTSFWTDHPRFAETERWFFERARACFPAAGLNAVPFIGPSKRRPK
jgi:hypothetical protein